MHLGKKGPGTQGEEPRIDANRREGQGNKQQETLFEVEYASKSHGHLRLVGIEDGVQVKR